MTTNPQNEPASEGPAFFESANEANLRAILETAVEGIVTINHVGIVEAINPAAVQMFGYPADEVIGRNVKLLMPAPYREEHDQYLANYLQTGRMKIIGIGREVVGRRKDGTTFPMDLSVAEFKTEGESHFTGFLRDITERKQAEQDVLAAQRRALQAERLAVIGQMVSVLSHESRNFLQRIQVGVEMLELEIEDDPQALAEVARIQRASEGLRGLLEEVRLYVAPLDARPIPLLRLVNLATGVVELGICSAGA